MTENITLTADTLTMHAQGVRSLIHSPIWFWISMAQTLLTIILIIRFYRRKPQLIIREIERVSIKEAVNEDIDMGELMKSINKAAHLYKALSSKCHPDRFINHPKHKLAEEIFQEITLYRRNYKKLYALRERAIIDLNVKL